MTSVRKIKKFFFRRQWFSSAQTYVGTDGQTTVWPMKRHGLAYHDVRSHCLIRRSYPGTRALLTVPYDDLHQDRKVWKKKDKETEKAHHRKVRDLREQKHPFMERMSFKDAERFYEDHDISMFDEASLAPHIQALNRRHQLKRAIHQKDTKTIIRLMDQELGIAAKEVAKNWENRSKITVVSLTAPISA